MADSNRIADILGVSGAKINADQFARTCDILGSVMKLNDDRVTTTHDIGDWLIDVVAPAVREAARKGEL